MFNSFMSSPMKHYFKIFFVSFIALMSQTAEAEKKGVEASPAFDFLNTIGACVHVQHGQDAFRIAPLLKYVGIRNVRDAADKNYDTSGLLLLNREAGVKVVIGPGSGAIEKDLAATIKMARELHHAGALLAIEGPNEPNNFGGLIYKQVKGGKDLSWAPVAYFQKDLYEWVKQDLELMDYPVYGVSETGAQTDNCGLQFLEIPENSSAHMPAGTRYADFANCHNYMYHPSWGNILHDNQVWNAADPTSECHADGLYGNSGKTWLKGFQGYSEEDLLKLPRVTTETGVRVGDVGGAVTEHVQGCNYLNLFLAQYKRGWDKTFIYEFLDDPDGAFGFYGHDYTTKRKCADYMHNFTQILNDGKRIKRPGSLDYSFAEELPATVHDLLLQKSGGEMWLVIWGERVNGKDEVSVILPTKVKRVEVYDPVVGVSPIKKEKMSKNKRNISLSISDHPVVVRII